MGGLLSRIRKFGQKPSEVEAEMPTPYVRHHADDTEMTRVENGAPTVISELIAKQNDDQATAELPEMDASSLQLSSIEVSLLQGEIIEKLRTIYDPEIPVNIYELGLIYDIIVTPNGAVDIKMTLTSPGCPVAGTLPPEVQDKAASVPGVSEAKVELVWEPSWNMDMMSDEAKLELGLF